MNVEVTNDFLEYLLKTMISGLGIPPEYLSYSEQTEFARSLGMMNGKFVRDIIVKQKVFAEQFTTLFRNLYRNEFLTDYNVKEKEKIKKQRAKRYGKDEKGNEIDPNSINVEDNFDIESLEVKFPSPQALNMTAQSEQINAGRDIIDFVATTLVSEDDTELLTQFKRDLTQDMLGSLNWAKYKDILEKSKTNKISEQLKKASASADSDDAGGGEY